MTALKAREIAEESLNGPATERLLSPIFAKIEEAAKRGEFSVTIPLKFNFRVLSQAQKVSLKNNLESLGFSVVASSDAAEISW